MGDRTTPSAQDDDKQTEAGVGGITTQEFRQNHSSERPPMPHELTAEWTVRAQLRFARAGETVQREFGTNDPVNPVRVVYKWSTLDDNANAQRDAQREKDKLSENINRNSSRTSAHSNDPFKSKQEESFGSTTSSKTCDFGGGDSAFSGSNNSNKPQKQFSTFKEKTSSGPDFYGTRCRSTCNITVSAVADFLPPPEGSMKQGENPNVTSSCSFIPEEEPDPFVFNTTASYTVLPEKSFDEVSFPETSAASSTFASMGKILNLRDAFCQTSDTETKYFDELDRKRDARRSYDYRRATADARLQHADFGGRCNEGSSFLPSFIPSPTQTFKSSSMPRIPSLGGGGTGIAEATEKPTGSSLDPPKKPRTVHIDVYCTGSEDDDQADGESSSDSDDDNKKLDQESNSTFQTVLDNEQMRLRHQRITGQALPRRLIDHQPNKKVPKHASMLPSADCGDLKLGHALTKSTTAEEVHESKQLLFRKHVGDQRAVKLQNLRQKYMRQPSDDALSLGYPNSSRSTIRDNTCSSISSVLASQDVVDSSWNETDEPEECSYSLAKSDSFEYENALDRLRIRQMERLWSRSHSNEDESQISCVHPGGRHLQTISEVTSSQRNSQFASELQRNLNLPSQSEIYSETEKSYMFPTQQPICTSPTLSTSDTANSKFHQSSHFSKNRPGFLQFFGPNSVANNTPQSNETVLTKQTLSAPVQSNIEPSLLCPNYQSGLQRWKSETRNNLSASGTPAITPTDLSRPTSPPSPSPPYINRSLQRSGSEAPPDTSSAYTFPVTTPTPARRLDMYHRESPAVSESSNQPPPAGYSSEYLDIARKFGKVVAVRKPGHHVGPTKNPNCSCESCQRWLAERFQIRTRAFSLGETPLLKKPS